MSGGDELAYKEYQSGEARVSGRKVVEERGWVSGWRTRGVMASNYGYFIPRFRPQNYDSDDMKVLDSNSNICLSSVVEKHFSNI